MTDSTAFSKQKNEDILCSFQERGNVEKQIKLDQKFIKCLKNELLSNSSNPFIPNFDWDSCMPTLIAKKQAGG